MVFLTYELKLRTGFFKTEQYNLGVNENKIVLAPKKNQMLQEIIIMPENLKSISLSNKNNNLFELEIQTQQGIFVGDLLTAVNIKRLLIMLNKNFAGKFIFKSKGDCYENENDF